MRRRHLAWIPLLLCALAVPAAGNGERPAYPATKKVEAAERLHGHRFPDPYRWLEDDADEQVVAWDEAQYRLLRTRLDAFPRRAALRERLDSEYALGGMKSLPRFEGGYRWYTYRPRGAEQPILYRTDEAAEQAPTIVLNPNTWSREGTAAMRAWTVSPDGRYVAYRRGDEGSEDTTLYVWDANAGKHLPDRINRTKFSSLTWAPDSGGFFYNRMPDPDSVPKGQEQYHDRIYYHRLGGLLLDDPLVYGRGRPMLEGCWLYRSADEKQLFLSRGLPYKSVETFEAKYAKGRLELTPVIAGKDERTWVDKVGETYIFDTDRNTGRREIFTATRGADGAIGTWRPVEVPRSDKGVVKGVVPVGDRHLVCHVKDDLVSRLYVRPIAGGAVRQIELPGPGTVGRTIATKLGDSRIWFSFQSYARPATIFRCDVASEDLALAAEDSMPTTVKIDGLVSTQTIYPSKDGTPIPVFLLHKKGLTLDGTQPVVLYGYGGFRVGLYPYFSRTRALWAEMGGVYVTACLRGGDEYGEAWHEAGCLANKQNVFDDFIAAADWLVETGKASRDRLAIQGGSNGGLLVAACVNQRPDLCRAAICSVPLTDMLRYHRFQYARSWTKEYGDPDVPEEFAWIRPYSPYHNVQPATAYPGVMVTAGIKDSRVNAFHARKIVARWQEASMSTAPILLRIDRKGGHGAAGLTRRLEEVLDGWCFLLGELESGR